MNPTKPAPTGDNPSDAQLGEDWESRFKGLQREFNKQQTEFKATKEALDAANLSVKDGGEALTAAQNEASQARNEISSLQKQLQDKDKELSTVNTKLASFEARGAIRTKLVNQKATDVLPFFEKGFLNFESDDDTVITSTIEAFREELKGNGGYQPPLGGSSVPNTTPAEGGGVGQMNAEQMWSYLNNPANFTNPDKAAEYQSVQEQYDKLVQAK